MFQRKQNLKIREIASFIGTLTSTFPANEYVPLHYRAILKSKGDFLKLNKGNYNARIKLAVNALQELRWWGNKIFNIFIHIRNVKISRVIYIDTSLEGWGASHGNIATGGARLPDEKKNHMNF